VKKTEAIMEILAAYDLTQSFRDAAELTGCSHHTVARYVRARDAGQLQTTPVQRSQVIDPFRDYIETWVDESHGRVRADVVQTKLEALGLGYAGSERTVRRAVAEAKAAYRSGHRRRFRPWLPEPGLWFQWDYADGALIEGRKTWLFCAWLAWSRFRVVLPVRDKTLPTVIACIDTTLRRFGGAPTYGLSDNEKTLTLDHIARIAVRHPTIVEVGRHYGLTFASCVRLIPSRRAAARLRCASPPPTWCPPRPICCRTTRASPSIGGRVSASATRSTRVRTAPRAARRPNGWRKNASGSTRCQPNRSPQPSA
jgi:transposase